MSPNVASGELFSENALDAAKLCPWCWNRVNTENLFAQNSSAQIAHNPVGNTDSVLPVIVMQMLMDSEVLWLAWWGLIPLLYSPQRAQSAFSLFPLNWGVLMVFSASLGWRIDSATRRSWVKWQVMWHGMSASVYSINHFLTDSVALFVSLICSQFSGSDSL